ncbi:SH3 domain protein [Histophilus somni]|nr:SH3 domain protein [Histophilus somni]
MSAKKSAVKSTALFITFLLTLFSGFIMKKITSLLVSALLLGFSLSNAYAETKYVKENLTTFMRRGAGDQFKISGTIQAGESVTVLDKKDKYSLIRDKRNREAWILTSELTSTPSSREENPKLKAQIQELTLKLNNIDNDWKQRTSEMQRRTKQAEEQSSKLLEQNSLLNRELEITKNKNRDLEAMLDVGKREIAIQWFIYGGSVLGAGLLLGLILPLLIPKRRRQNRWS